jgi:hypothetical protein
LYGTETALCPDNGPRAGINWNDGFAGNNRVEGNLVFNMVRETGDHGPFNSCKSPTEPSWFLFVVQSTANVYHP